jgi:hypothetical protein
MKKYILLLLLGVIGTLHAQTIPVPEIKVYSNFYSTRFNWCAPACAECVLKYHNFNYGQCDIMDYIRINFGLYGGLNGFGCCSPDPPDQSHPCDERVPLGFYNESVSIKNLINHFSNGILSGPTFKSSASTNDITYFLNHNQALIAQWEWDFTDEAHVVVIYGIENGNTILYMDPDLGIKTWLSYNQFVSNGTRTWKGTLLCCPSSRGYPCHCYNNQYDPDLGELGIDCGGPDCPPCSTPPLNHCHNRVRDADETGIDCGGVDCPPCTLCNNCILDPGEDAIDCGGSCPPCKYVGNVTDEEIITNTNQLSWEVMAFKKITACCATTVASGREVRFITKKTGSIVLLPGFTAEHGSNFSTQMKDLSQYERLCGGACHNHTLTSTHKAFFDYLQIKNLPYAVGIDYDIYKSEGWAPDPICSRNLKISSDGDHVLWNCIDGTVYPTGTVSYKIVYKIHYCNYTSYYSTHYFTVNYPSNKSSTEDSEDQNSSPQFSPSNPNDIPFPSATAPPHFVIIPNPNSGTFQLETNFPLTDIANLKIVNLFGVSVYETKTITEHTLQLQNSASGMFFVVIILKDGTVLTQKMVVQR